MSDRSGVSRGDRNRNARLARLREVVPPCIAIAGVDLADAKQMVVVTDHESRVLARRVFRRRAWDLGAALDWAAGRAAAAGFAGVSVAVEPAGHRWTFRVGRLKLHRCASSALGDAPAGGVPVSRWHRCQWLSPWCIHCRTASLAGLRVNASEPGSF